MANDVVNHPCIGSTAVVLAIEVFATRHGAAIFECSHRQSLIIAHDLVPRVGSQRFTAATTGDQRRALTRMLGRQAV